MAVLVEHDKRKHEILEKALELFVEEGYEDVTFQKIADRCGITRTTLYIYFKNKREIFLWSIKQLISGLEVDLVSLVEREDISTKSCLLEMFNTIIDHCQQNQQLFRILLSYLLQLQKSGVDVNERVMRRVIRMQHLLNTVIIRGQKRGEIQRGTVKEINELLYSLVESAIFKLSVLGQSNIDSSRAVIAFAINSICS
mgnify:FL=1